MIGRSLASAPIMAGWSIGARRAVSRRPRSGSIEARGARPASPR